MVDNSKHCVGVMGLGYVGLPLVMALVEAGFEVVGFDTDLAKVKALQTGICYLKHIEQTRIKAVCRSSMFKVTVSPENLVKCNTVLICVPTPLSEGREPDLSFVEQAAEQVSIYAEDCKLVILESTTWPGTTRDVVAPYFKHDFEIKIAYSPEREDPGNEHYWLATTPKLVGGLTPDATLAACDLYSHICKTVVPVDSPEIAEAAKCFENTFRMVNISLVNEFKVLCQRLDIDPFKVIAASDTKPFGFKAFWPGPGVGGHCIFCDPFYLTWKARQVGTPLKFVEAAWEVNAEMPRRVGRSVADALNTVGKPLKRSRVLIIGAAYKKNIGDTRESPSKDVVRWLLNRQADVFLHDLHCPEAAVEFGCKECRLLCSSSIDGADVVVILTDHDTIVWSDVYAHARLIVDTRNVFPPGGKVVQA